MVGLRLISFLGLGLALGGEWVHMPASPRPIVPEDSLLCVNVREA